MCWSTYCLEVRLFRYRRNLPIRMMIFVIGEYLTKVCLQGSKTFLKEIISKHFGSLVMGTVYTEQLPMDLDGGNSTWVVQQQRHIWRLYKWGHTITCREWLMTH